MANYLLHLPETDNPLVCVKKKSHEICLHPDGSAGPRKDNASICKKSSKKSQLFIGVVSGVISSPESESEESERFHFFRFLLRPRRLWSSENWVVGVESRSGRPNQSQGPESNIVIGLFFRLCLRLRQCSFHLIVSDGVITKISVLLPTPSVWFSLDRIALRFWLRLRLWLRR